MEKKFKLKKDGFSEVKKKIIIGVLIILLPALFFMFSILTEGYTKKIKTIVITITVSSPVVFLMLFYFLKKKKQQYESFELIVSENEVIRKQLYRKDILIPKKEIKSIIGLNKKRITIQGNSISKAIFIPYQIEDIEKLRLLLGEIPLYDLKQIENKKKLSDIDLNGKWKGVLSLGKQYGKNKGKEIFYEADFIQKENKITGVSNDISGFGLNPEPADIIGGLEEFKISFIKQYRIFHALTSTNEIKLDRSKKSPKIYFTGFFNEDSNSFEGNWRMPMAFKLLKIIPMETEFTGTWIMKKSIL